MQDQTSQEILYKLWNECVPIEFFKHICKNDNFLYLNEKNVLHSKSGEIVWQFIEENVENYRPLRDHFLKYKNTAKSILTFFPLMKLEE